MLDACKIIRQEHKTTQPWFPQMSEDLMYVAMSRAISKLIVYNFYVPAPGEMEQYDAGGPEYQDRFDQHYLSQLKKT